MGFNEPLFVKFPLRLKVDTDESRSVVFTKSIISEEEKVDCTLHRQSQLPQVKDRGKVSQSCMLSHFLQWFMSRNGLTIWRMGKHKILFTICHRRDADEADPMTHISMQFNPIHADSRGKSRCDKVKLMVDQFIIENFYGRTEQVEIRACSRCNLRIDDDRAHKTSIDMIF